MRKPQNELDQWLIRNWMRAHELEESMNRMRTVHQERLQRIAKRVQEKYPVLDRSEVKPGQLGFGKLVWPTDWASWPTGFWIYDLDLDNVMAENGKPACASIWLGLPRSAKKKLESARAKFAGAAAKLLKAEKFPCRTNDEDDPDDQTCFCYSLPQSPKLIADLILNRKEDQLGDCLVRHIGILIRFIPVVDEFFKIARNR